MLAEILSEIAPTRTAQAKAIGVPRLAVIRWTRADVGVRSTEHARAIIAALSRARPVTIRDWQTVCADSKEAQ
jgi:hypothetical protein